MPIETIPIADFDETAVDHPYPNDEELKVVNEQFQSIMDRGGEIITSFTVQATSSRRGREYINQRLFAVANFPENIPFPGAK